MIPGSLDGGEAIDLTRALRRLSAFFRRLRRLSVGDPGRSRI